jgi:hypothetical protein
MADDFRDLFKDWRPGEDGPPGGEPARPRRGGGGGDDETGGGEGGDLFASTSETENRAPRALNEKEVKVMGIWGYQDAQNPDAAPKQTFVLLRDNRGRRAPIFIGPFETFAISMALEGQTVDRPLTHDLLKNLIDRLGGSVERITIDDLWQGTFYAKITIAQKNGQTQDIDARPSDAIALALRTKSPIYMAEDVIERIKDDQDPE